MASKIIFDDGKEVALSKETTERLRKELLNNVPNCIYVGQIFEISGSKYMVAVLGDGHGAFAKGITCVGSMAGCWNPKILNGYTSDTKLRGLLIKKNAKYLGMFYEVFKTM